MYIYNSESPYNLQVTIRTINDCLSVLCMIFFEFAICAIIYIKNIFIQLVIIIRLHTLHLMRSAMLSLPLRCSILIYKLYLVFIKSYIFMFFLHCMHTSSCLFLRSILSSPDLFIYTHNVFCSYAVIFLYNVLFCNSVESSLFVGYHCSWLHG